MARKLPVFFRRIQSLLKYALLGATLTLFILLGHGEANLRPFLTSLPLLKAGISSVSAQSPINASQLIEEGRKSYEKGAFSDAVTFWQQAARLFAIQEDRLDRAQVLSFISLAYQQLGQWGKAEEAIRGSLNLLRTEENSPILAQALTNKGHLQLALGKAEDALKTWQQATDIYVYLKDKTGATGSLVNQSLAMQESGLYHRACETLLPALKLENSFCNLSSETEQPISEQLVSLKNGITEQPDCLIRGVGLRSLGDVLRVIGKLEESQQVLQQSLEMAKRLNSSIDISAVNLSLGNTERALYNRTKDLYDRTELTQDRDDAKEIAHKALGFYQQVGNKATSEVTWIHAQLNRLSLLLDFRDWLLDEKRKSNSEVLNSDVDNLQLQIQAELENLPIIQSNLAKLPLNQTAIYARLNLAQSLISNYLKDEFLSTAIQLAQVALQQSEDLKDKRVEAYAIGILGSLYEQKNDLSIAQEFTQEALSLAQSIYALDIAYQWQWQLGRIFEKLNNIENHTEKAIIAYDAAVKTLNIVRRDLLAINPDVQFSFRNNVKPVYEEFIRLLLQLEHSQKNLKQVTEVSGQLQLAELENFLQCRLQNLVPINEVKTPPDAVIYMILLENQHQVEIIVSLPKQSPPLYHYYKAQWNEVKQNVNALRDTLQYENLRKKRLDAILPDAQKLYKLLIAPIKSYLPEKGTLAFVLDSTLQNIPMALLQDDEQHYLIDKYSLSLIPSSQVREAQPSLFNKLGALIAGLSIKSLISTKLSQQFKISFPALEKVDEEVNAVKNETVYSEQLTNNEFIVKNLQNQVKRSSFPVLHLATHGLFSSDPEKTFILAYDDLINVRQLDLLVKSRTQSSFNTIELLVLSACQTARGDKRGGLGMAGVAVQAGAESTLATLWNVSDSSTSKFMTLFYQGLKAGATKAEALRQAQLTFLNNPQYKDKGYDHPYHWAAFILLGNGFNTLPDKEPLRFVSPSPH